MPRAGYNSESFREQELKGLKELQRLEPFWSGSPERATDRRTFGPDSSSYRERPPRPTGFWDLESSIRKPGAALRSGLYSVVPTALRPAPFALWSVARLDSLWPSLRGSLPLLSDVTFMKTRRPSSSAARSGKEAAAKPRAKVKDQAGGDEITRSAAFRTATAE